MNDYKTIQELEGKTISNAESNREEIIFDCTDGERYRMYHEQDCCESVWFDRTSGGELTDLIGSEIIKATESPGCEYDPNEVRDSVTFTDFVLKTPTKEITIHWVGESNGYYSESVYFTKL